MYLEIVVQIKNTSKKGKKLFATCLSNRFAETNTLKRKRKKLNQEKNWVKNSSKDQKYLEEKKRRKRIFLQPSFRKTPPLPLEIRQCRLAY